MIFRFLLFLLLLLLIPYHSFSADDKGHYFMGGGAGAIKCYDFVASMEKGRALGVNSLAYVEETRGFTMYVLGFQTGYNLAAAGVYDIFKNKASNYEILSWIEEYCRNNPEKLFGHSVAALAFEESPGPK